MDEQTPADTDEVEVEEAVAPWPVADGNAWWELGAVFAVGVVPHLVNTIIGFGHSWARTPFWVDATALIASSVCSAYVVLYLIYRSGEPWSAFGVTRPSGYDLAAALPLALGSITLYYAVSHSLPTWYRESGDYLQTRAPWEKTLLVVTYALSGFAEELICRAYLVTRLQGLRRSSIQAVLIAALLFASYHLYQGPAGFIDAFLFGVLYGSIFVLYRRLWPLAIAHTLTNVYL